MTTLLVIMNEHGAPTVISDSDTPVNVIFMESSMLSHNDVFIDGEGYLVNEATSSYEPKKVRDIIQQRHANCIAGVYTSHFEEGDIETTALLDLNTFILNITVSDQGDQFECHQFSDFTFELDGRSYTLLADNDELADESIGILKSLLPAPL